MTRIRAAKIRDSHDIRGIYLSAFPDEGGPAVAALAVDLLEAQSEPDTFALVAEIDGEIVGHIAFSPLASDGHPDWQGYILSPLAVSPAAQKHSIGTALVTSGMEEVKARGARTLLVYGDPGYYGRFGFSAAEATPYVPPYALEYPFGWQAIEFDGQPDSDDDIRFTCVESLRHPELW